MRSLCITASVRFPENRNKLGTNVSLSPTDLCYAQPTHPLQRDPVRVPAQLNTAKTAKLLAAPTLAPAILVSTNNDINDNKLANGGAALPP